MPTLEQIRLSWRSWLTRDENYAGPWWMGFVWTLVFCLVVAAGFTALGYALSAGESGKAASLWHWYQINLMISLCIGYAIQFMFMASIRVVGRARLRRMQGWRRTAFFSVVPVIGVAIGWPLGLLWALGVDLRRWILLVPGNVLLASAIICTLITLVFHQFFMMKTRQIQAENRATEAQLRLLQGQIEPHFLFNTLANVTSLMEADPARAKVMLESFVDYLRASLAGLGQATHTLGDEIELIEAYLRIIKIRMDDRLGYSIDVPAALRTHPLPALTLQPLVENAIVHGLEPKISGGHIHVGARLAGGTLVITVDDDGTGMVTVAAGSSRRAGTGTALNNIRLRLQQLYGSAASLSVEAAEPHGVRALLALPLAA